MKTLISSTNMVLLDFARAVLRESGIEAAIVDSHMSVMEGSLGVLPRRLLVPEGMDEAARRVLHEAGLGSELALR